MEVVIVSNCALIREGLCSIIPRFNNIKVSVAVESLKEANLLISKEYIDIVFFDLNEHNEAELMLIKKIKDCGIKTKFIILDFNNNKELFVKAIKCGVEGYILGKSSELEILHTIEQIYKGKKYFDAYFIDSMINEKDAEPEDITHLTPREKEILCEIGKGMSNKKISEKLYISEHTVKKHINHIFEKLNLSDRTHAALFAIRCGIMSKNAS
jgi:DNA-binding NarL/FixJ family response regulator